MKIKSVLLAGAVAALPLAAVAQQQPSQQQPSQQPSQQQVTMNESGDMKVTTTTGRVQSYDAGHTITITTADGKQTTYTINQSSRIPKTVEIGKTVTIHTSGSPDAPVVKTVTITTTKETKAKSY